MSQTSVHDPILQSACSCFGIKAHGQAKHQYIHRLTFPSARQKADSYLAAGCLGDQTKQAQSIVPEPTGIIAVQGVAMEELTAHRQQVQHLLQRNIRSAPPPSCPENNLECLLTLQRTVNANSINTLSTAHACAVIITQISKRTTSIRLWRPSLYVSHTCSGTNCLAAS